MEINHLQSLSSRYVKLGLRLIVSLICCVGGVQMVLAESGIVAWKEQAFHADSAAKVFYFDRFEPTGPITWFYQGDKRKGFEPGQAYDMILLPNSLEELSSKIGLDALKTEYVKLVAFSNKYTAAKVMLKDRLWQMKTYLESHDAAEVKVGQKWVPVANDLATKGNQEVAPKVAAPSYLNEAVAIGVIYLVILMLLTLRRKRTLILFLLVLPFFVGFGWLSYKEGGVEWMKEIPIRMKAIYDRFGIK